jgi:hypothetical protein
VVSHRGRQGQLRLPERREDGADKFAFEPSPVAVLAGRRDAVLNEEVLKKEGRSGSSSQLSYLLLEAALEDFTNWAAWVLLSQMQRRLASVRDDIAATGTRRLAGREIRRIHNEFLRDSLDSRTAAAELRAYATRRRHAITLSADWQQTGKFEDQKLDAHDRYSLRVYARVLAESEQRLRDALIAETNLISAIANLRTQRRVGVGAIVVTVVAAAHPNLHHLWSHVPWLGS